MHRDDDDERPLLQLPIADIETTVELFCYTTIHRQPVCIIFRWSLIANAIPFEAEFIAFPYCYFSLHYSFLLPYLKMRVILLLFSQWHTWVSIQVLGFERKKFLGGVNVQNSFTKYVFQEESAKKLLAKWKELILFCRSDNMWSKLYKNRINSCEMCLKCCQ